MIIKTALIACVVLCGVESASAQVHVNGYTRSNGTYVEPHYRSAPNGTTSDNYSTRGNQNPYTGSYGAVSPYGGSTGSSYNLGGSGGNYSGLGTPRRSGF